MHYHKDQNQNVFQSKIKPLDQKYNDYVQLCEKVNLPTCSIHPEYDEHLILRDIFTTKL